MPFYLTSLQYLSKSCLHLSTLILLPLGFSGVLNGCGAEDLEQPVDSSSAIMDHQDDSKLTLPLPKVDQSEWEASEGEREMLRERLMSLYDGLTANADQVAHVEIPAEDCLDCGRETGFLPTPDMSVDGFTLIESKDVSYMLLSWEESTGATTYQMMIAQVYTREEDGYMVSAITTDTLDVGISLAHGFSYVVYLSAHNEMDKTRSLPSNPLFIHCGSEEGCTLIN